MMVDPELELITTEEMEEELYEIVKPTILYTLRGMGLSFSDVKFSAGARKGEAFLGQILKIHTVSGKKGVQKNMNFVVKFGFAETIRNIRPLRKGYEREVFMYETVLPMFKTLEEDKQYPFNSYPTYYDSNYSKIPEFILLSDMRYEQFEMHERTDSLNYEHMFLAVTHYAKFHALSFALRRHRRHKFAQMKIVLKRHFDLAIKDIDVEFINVHLERAIGALNPDTDKDALIKFQELLDNSDINTNLYTLMVDATESHKAGKYEVVCHGDACITNLMFRYGDKHRFVQPLELIFLDFQLAKLGSPALDLSQLFFTCTDATFRERFYDELLHEYHKKLLEFGSQLRVDIDMTFETLNQHMKQFSIYGLYKAIFNLYLQMCTDSDIPGVEKILRWSDCVQNFNYSCSNVELYKERIRGVLNDFVKYNYYLY